MKIDVKAFAKLNISLDVVSRMADGYHEMLMVMQSVDLCDDVSVTVEAGDGIAVSTSLRYLPADMRNIAAKAAGAFLARAGIRGRHVSIAIKKRIPVCAGLGGGSADGAAVLRALNALLDTRLTVRELEEIGAEVGSDVPFCVRCGTALATGRGNVLEDLPPLPDCAFVIVKPQFAVSTPELFSRLDCAKIRNRPDTAGLVDALRAGNLAGIAHRMYNVFEDALPRGREEIDAIRGELLDNHALGAIMTGTGSAVFGLFDSYESAHGAWKTLSGRRECFAARAVGKYEV
ncbi:MAG: 4-(cytidine 5'-diphospho)-2-C-methyl-D-erythritol kinase [Oscillospiraceae bacterium]|jgi:4-diphosphocytidyl-2-C-methyl-D-erythritol kinase|nr:4-(cytidine 5'-diphospho)-2-C-methyl-D-erythritol kinase [Oscillospiraceae bacterium]